MNDSKRDEPRITLELLEWLDLKCPPITTSNIFQAASLDILKYAAGRRQAYEAVLALFNRQNNTDGKPIRKPKPTPSHAGGDSGADRPKGRRRKKEGGDGGGGRDSGQPQPSLDP